MEQKTSRKPKIFVLDTNVILHDHNAIRKFQDNDLVIPVAVIEEVDKFKKGTDALAFNARGFMRSIDKITAGRLFPPEGRKKREKSRAAEPQPGRDGRIRSDAFL